jgi:endonuclease YncB( thermonuclease family)
MTRRLRALALWLSLLLLLLLAPLPDAAPAATRFFEGTVTHVTDGDTLWVRPDGGGRPRKLRLQGIDAPESCQAWGPQARSGLRTLVHGQRVRVEQAGRDDHGRGLARLQRGGVDVAAQLVLQGHAWSHRFGRRPGPYDREEEQARRARRGLFAAHRPEPPREFRRRHGPCR